MNARSVFLVGVLSLAASARAQICLPMSPSMGQPTLAGVGPACSGTVPLPTLHSTGNPGFALASFAPPPAVAAGSQTWLAIFLGPSPLVSAPAVHPYCFGEIPRIPAFGQILVALVPAGPSGPTPGAPVSIPLPPMPPGVSIRVATIGIDSFTCVFVTDGITVNT